MITFTTKVFWRQLPSLLHRTEISEINKSIKVCRLGFRNTMFHTNLENRSEIMETENKAKRKLSESSGKENSSNEKKNVVLQFAKLSEHAFTPVRGSAYAAGYDLFSAYDCVVPAHGKVLAKTDIQIALPDRCYGRIAPRSGLAVKHFIDVGAGVIDQDYRGNVGVLLFNFGGEDFKVNKGDRIAQLVLERIFLSDLEELPKLDETVRGGGGFGSTGSR